METNNNTKTGAWIIVVTMILLVGGTFWYQISTREVGMPAVKEETRFVPQIVNAKYQYRDDAYTVVGEVDLPTPCYLLESNSFVEIREPATDRATIQFTTTGDDEICAQVITPVRFKEVFNAQEGAEITATWNGQAVRLNLIEASENENLDDFELFIKG